MKIIGPMRPILGYPIGQSLELEPLEPSRPPPNKKSNGLVMIVFHEYFSVEKKINLILLRTYFSKSKYTLLYGIGVG